MPGVFVTTSAFSRATHQAFSHHYSRVQLMDSHRLLTLITV
jgi:restriction endonuclease Mrr